MAGAALIAHRQAREARRLHPPVGRFVTVRDPVATAPWTMISSSAASSAGCRKVPRHRVRPPWLWPQRAPERHALDRECPGIAPPRTVQTARLRPRGRGRPFLGNAGGPFVRSRSSPPCLGPCACLGILFSDPRADVALFSPPAIPVVGTVISHTVAPLIGEAIAPKLIAKMFLPQRVSPKCAAQYPLALALRPAADSNLGRCVPVAPVPIHLRNFKC